MIKVVETTSESDGYSVPYVVHRFHGCVDADTPTQAQLCAALFTRRLKVLSA